MKTDNTTIQFLKRKIYLKGLLSLTVLIALLAIDLAATAQSTDRNLILERTYKAGISTISGNVKDATQQVTYIDGLGRTLQAVNAQASPKMSGTVPADLVVHTEYDANGRVSKQYSVYPVQGNGSYQSTAATAAVSYYNNGSNCCVPNDRGYLLNEYEPLPGGRLKKQYQPGSDRAVEFTYGGNATDEVKRYTVSGTTLQNSGNYGAGQLSWVETKDENNNSSREFQDKNGRVVLKRVYLDSDWLSTYYVYDDYSQLRFVLQPKYQDDANLDLYAFKYQYNSKGLLVSKSIPGGGTTTMVYDERDRLIESTDGRSITTYIKYDDLNRTIETGLKEGANQNAITKTQYDTYTYSPSFGDVAAFVSAGTGYASNYRSEVKGKSTVTANRILNPDGTYGAWLYATTYYDDRFNDIQLVRSLFDIGGTATERKSLSLRFDGRIDKEITVQQTGSGDYSVEKIYAYDHSDRQVSARYIVKKGTTTKKDVFLSANRYNAVGQLKNKYLHSSDAGNSYREKLDYCYTPRAFLSKITGAGSTGENFGVELRYSNPSFGTAQYNGNIAEMLWKRSGNWIGYKLEYDKANRLKNSEGISNNNRETISSYDKNGNILSLERVLNGTAIDNLSYTYSSGNRLSKITDAATSEGFNNGSSGTSNDYVYDQNGNLTQDLNRGIAAGGITYNPLNLVGRVVQLTNTVQYHYDGSGLKLRMSNTNGAVNTKYAGAYEYNQGNYLTRIATDEGQVNVTNNGNDFALEYYLKDHLGNIRQVMNESGTMVQETEYYPFGLAIPRTAGTNKYLYNGKEKQPETNWLDYGARMYDPTIGRWMVVDPLAERFYAWSPYNYTFNNPIRLIDPTGKGPEDPINHKVKIGETLSSISKQYGVSVKDLAILNGLQNVNKINAGFSLKVNPEMDFSNNPNGGYQNPNSSAGEVVNMDNIINVGLGFIVGAGSENTVVAGGGALQSVKNWDKVQDLISAGTSAITADGKLSSGETFSGSYSPGSLMSYLGGVVKGKEKLVSPVHVIGSFGFSMRVNADGSSATVAVYDSKTNSSLSDHKLGTSSDKVRNSSMSRNQPLTNQYFRFIWNQPLK